MTEIINLKKDIANLGTLPTQLKDSLFKLENRIFQTWNKNNTLSKDELTNCIEWYFVTATQLGYINQKNLNHICNCINDIVSIEELPIEQRNVYGITTTVPGNKKIIQYNPDIPASKHLTSEARTIVYLYHELGHGFAFNDNKAFVDFVTKDKNINSQDTTFRQLAVDGTLCIEEYVVQEMAEEIYHTATKQKRCDRHYIGNIYMYGTSGSNRTRALPTRLDYYGELEEPVLQFAKTLKGVGNPYLYNGDINNEALLQSISHDLCKKAMQPDVCKDIITEYLNSPIDKKEEVLLTTMAGLGYLVNAKYQSFGARVSLNHPTSVSQCNEFYEYVKDVTDENMDFDTTKIDWHSCYPEYLQSTSNNEQSARSI